MKRKYQNKKKTIIITTTFIFIILLFFSITLIPDRKQNKFFSLIKDTTTSIEKVIFYPFKFIINKVSDYKELYNIKEKYDALLPEVERIESLYTENTELRKELSDLKEELNITNVLSEYSYLNATVINRNITSWYNTITVDKGTYNGVEVNMAVVNSEGLIGKVVSVTTFTSDIKLLTSSDSSNKISVTISNNNSNIYGLVKKYNTNTNYLEVEGVSNTKNVLVGDYVYTSGLGEIFPSGILIGKVANIDTDEYDLAKIIEVEPITNFDDINYVAILKRKENNQ